jgi:large subunit ribosomal protein L30
MIAKFMITNNNTIRIKLIRSGIDHPSDQKRTLKALGFTKLNQVVEKEDNVQVRGMIRKVHHLVMIIND